MLNITVAPDSRESDCMATGVERRPTLIIIGFEYNNLSNRLDDKHGSKIVMMMMVMMMMMIVMMMMMMKTRRKLKQTIINTLDHDDIYLQFPPETKPLCDA